MKVMFITGSMEPGRDGVGDYIRRMSGELIHRGISVSVLALHDRHCQKHITVMQQSDGHRFLVMRIPDAWSAVDRYDQAYFWMEEMNPDWVSLQYVPFAFHIRGFHKGLGKLLSRLGDGRRWHIMLHEMWVGMAKEEPFKLQAWGWVQRFFIRSLLEKLQPEFIHTNTFLYREYLAQWKFKSVFLPVFSNIPATGAAHLQAGKPFAIREKREIIFVVFGSIHRNVPIVPFAEEASVYAKANNVPVSLVFLGRCGGEQERWIKAWESAGLPFIVLGELSPARVSEVLQGCTIGLSSTACAVAQKSGSFAAMLEHGLPVIGVSNPWTPRGAGPQKTPAGMVIYERGKLSACLLSIEEHPGYHTVTEVAEVMATTLFAADELLSYS
ncbi:glycosyltransferase family 4 protein [Hufsiella ginkgonis]|uniref:Glycosyltransferase n=1 Tax=Hufsiella ginkgonis TaxID=2695274 RepID=A0A7K1Y346_9SPHI|nr:glycosyltransferase family 4 protein [Hufsiella ginkgonis]MXV17449.1 hypothetical protein [Hufsiella ginkgonis]